MTREQKRLIGIEPLAKGKYQMKRLTSLIICFLLPSLIIVGCGGSSDSGGGGNNDLGLRMGILQFITKHNLQDNTCLPDNCYLTLEEEEDTGTWLDQLESISNMAVLHWDRAIPWLVFDETPAPGASRSDFYDSRIDDGLRSWINTFADHFKRMSSGYLAVSILNGQRDGLQSCRIDEHQMVEVTSACPVLAPGTQIEFQYDPGSGPMTASFDLERSYTNFVMYLYDKLQPDYLALMVEVNWFKEMPAPCPANWDGLVQLYHHLYDTVRPEVDPRTKVFATLTYKELLGYDLETCHGPLAFEPCTGDPSPPAYADPDPETCYPLNLSPIDDLDQGNRLEVLALSFYPDALLMDVADDNLVKLYPEDWNGVDECDLRAQATPYLDPLEALDRFHWNKPIAIAELGARSNRTIKFKGGFLYQPPADFTSQSFWVNHFLEGARERAFEFYVQSYSNDFEPIGAWTVNMGVLDADLYSLLNTFAYMGIYDAQGSPKSGVTETWLDFLQN
jgi:hypothetical protein